MNKRISYIMGACLCLLAIIAARTAYLQLWESPESGPSLAAKALRYRTQAIPGEEYYRGEILDRHLLPLTDSQTGLALVGFPSGIDSITETANQLEEIIDLPSGATSTAFKRSQERFGNRTPVILKTNLTNEEVQKINDAVPKGIVVLPIKTRYGPGALASHIVGYLSNINEQQWEDLQRNKKTIDTNPGLPTSYQITDKIGVAGLEGKYEEVLRGSKPESMVLGFTDANGRLLPGLGFKTQDDTADPWRHHLVLTIDRKYQEIVETTMDEHLLRGAVVVLDITNGDVVAAASRPNFDQNQISKYLNGKDELIDRTNRVAFYPGSVFKMVVAAGVLEEGLATPDEVFHCTGTYGFSDGTVINCLGAHGEVTMEDAICRSCNTTFVQLGLRLGSSRFADYAAKLGFTVSVNNSSPPALVGNASIGQQGVLVSPLQIANLYATIARDGYYQPWRLVSEVRNYQSDVIYEYPNMPAIQVIKPSTCDILKKALIKAVEKGSGRQGWLEGLGTAGKTGTAQANDNDKVIAWFAGVTPIENPRLAIAVMVEENALGAITGLRGGEAAAPVFKKIAEQILQLEKEETHAHEDQ